MTITCDGSLSYLFFMEIKDKIKDLSIYLLCKKWFLDWTEKLLLVSLYIKKCVAISKVGCPLYVHRVENFKKKKRKIERIKNNADLSPSFLQLTHFLKGCLQTLLQ